MKTALRLLVLATCLVLCARAEDAKTPDAAALEAKFVEALAGVTMAGHSSPLKDGAVGEAKPDKYVIDSAKKVSGDDWVIQAHLKYRGQDLVIPVPVKVKWAGDTAVIIVDQMQLPGSGYATAYSARVLIHEGTYAGTWSGGDHGGLMSGAITKNSP